MKIDKVRKRLARIPSSRIFGVVGVASGSIEREALDGARQQLADWGVNLSDATRELERRVCFTPGPSGPGTGLKETVE